MAEVLVAYYSRSGNTQAMAELIAEGARSAGATAVVKSVEAVSMEDLLSADGIAVGSPTYYGTMAAPVKQLLDESVEIHGQLEGKAGAAFSSAGGPGGGQQTTIMDIVAALLIHGMVVQGDPQGDHYGPVATGKPDARAAEQCRRAGRRLAALAQRLHP
ncbi:MAG: flavodoxin family protein [Anaerolineae bacterium]|nr:flavodoxin family protein [Anaerolineae bacterium]